MIKHIALWRLKTPAEGQSKESIFAIIKEAIESQQAKIPGLTAAEVGLNFKESEKALDVAIYTAFVDIAALNAYHAHPVHHQTRAKVDAFVASSVFVDYEV
ncbi:Stress responsive A/B Barrel Domain protein (plasmid) [Variovorax sp. SRS16]|uniref:Dabb family protein n=1 Tax=Variovorax sp. SRS16 TaxID=282217 RepID=UPI0013192C08|nr:Dabb family protein [Variovorax sp. SRS16]VTU46695.1 Stress responsive A/B Barrel Domain protein [Variovorax sp. SRS16]